MSPFFNLLPFPRSLEELAGSIAYTSRVAIQAEGLSSEESDAFARLSQIVLGEWLSPGSPDALRVRVRLQPDYTLPETSDVSALLREESYELIVREDIGLTAGNFRGLQRGIQTVRQILEDCQSSGQIPCCRIADWPRLAHRGIHHDFAREIEYRHEHVKSIIERVASLKMNTFHLYLEAAFAYPSASALAHPCPMTPDDARDLVEHARIFGVALVPQISTLGHMENLLHGPYEELREDPSSPVNLCPSHPNARPFIAGLIRDVAQAFQPQFIHLGYDESHSGICPRCRQHGTPQDILAEYLNWMDEEVKSHGARSMIYADKFLSPREFPQADATNGGTPEQARHALSRVNRDIILTDWHYTAPYGQTVRALVEQGFEVHIVTDTGNYWHDAIPLVRGAHWVADTIDTAIAEGASGSFNCTWELYRGAWFENFWYFHGLAAERQWASAPHDFISFGARFSRRFWGVEKDFYSDIAALSEVVPVRRRRFFLDSDALSDGGMAQAARDYIGLADYLDRQLETFRAGAKRNAGTLQMLDMPALILRYMGARVLAQTLARNALEMGEPEKASAALHELKTVALRIEAKLQQGFELFGGGGDDLRRLRAHLHQIDDAMTGGGLSQRTTLQDFACSPLQAALATIADAPLPPSGLAFAPAPASSDMEGSDVRDFHLGKDGVLYLRASVGLPHGFRGKLLYGSDGPVKVWVNGEEIGCVPDATNPCTTDEYVSEVSWRAGENEVLFAFGTNNGKAWGLCARTASA